MFKKSISILLTVLVVMCFCFPAYAEEDVSSDTASISSDVSSVSSKSLIGGGLIQPCWTYLNTITNWMDINSSGQAAMVSNMIAYSNVDQIKMNNYLQKLENGAWKTVTSWSATYSGNTGYWSRTYYVTHGYYYRLRTYFYAYDGSNVEVTDMCTGSVYY